MLINGSVLRVTCFLALHVYFGYDVVTISTSSSWSMLVVANEPRELIALVKCLLVIFYIFFLNSVHC